MQCRARLGSGLGRAERGAWAAAIAPALVALMVVLVLNGLGPRSVGSQPLAAQGGSATLYNLVFNESGLPRGTLWSVDLSGTVKNATAPAGILYMQGIGNYHWSAPQITGWMPQPAYGTLLVSGQPPPVVITFLRAVNVTVHETGLAKLTRWSVSINTTSYMRENITLFSTDPSATFVLANGSYVLHPLSPVPGATGVRYISTTLNISVAVTGTPILRSVTYTTEFLLTTSSSPLAGGTTTPSTGWLANQSSVSVRATPSAGYVFSTWVGNGTGSYSGASNPVTVKMVGPIGERASFAALNRVSFSETGLPVGTNWSVALNGTKSAATTSTIVFYVPNGTYSYLITPLPGYSTNSYNGTVRPMGTNPTVMISWTEFTYAVTFSESGLPSGSTWSVTVNGVQRSSATTTVVFAEPNGTQSFSVGAVPGYHANLYSGSVTVNGAPISVALSWTVVRYTVTFSESGLPAGTTWTVTFNGSPASATSSTIEFIAPNGSFAFSITPVAGLQATPNSGNVQVNGASMTESVVWAAPVFPVTFSESGLPPGTNWSVTVAGVLHSSAASAIVVNEANGTYSFSVGAVTGFTASPATGSVSVSGAPVGQPIAFTSSTKPGSSSGGFSLFSGTGLYFLAGGLAAAAVVAALVAIGISRRPPKTVVLTPSQPVAPSGEPPREPIERQP